MDFLNKAFAQLSDLFRSMTPGARVTAGLLLAVVVISLGYLFRYEVSAADTYLMNGEPIPPSLMPQMEAAFAKAHLDSYEIVGSKIRVPRGQQGTYMGALADAKALPPRSGHFFSDAIEGSNPFETTQQREERARNALQEELSLAINHMKGIDSAMVIIGSEGRKGFGQDPVRTASVTAKALGGEPLTQQQVECIRAAVFSAAGLKSENVTVVDTGSDKVYIGGAPGGTGEDEYLAAKTRWESDLKAKILGSLSYIPNLTVEVNAQLDREKFNRVLTTEPTKPVVQRTMEKSKTNVREGGGSGGGRPGYQAQNSPNTPAALSASSSKGPHDEEEESTSETINATGVQQTEKETVGLTPELVKVAIAIPNSYFEKVWRERNPAAAGQEQKAPDQAALDQIRTEESGKVQKLVAALLPPAKGVTDLTELVTVTNLQDIKPAEIPLPGIGQKMLAWLGQYWSTLGMIGVGLVSLLVLRSMVRAAPGTAENAAVHVRVAAEPEAGAGESPESVAARRLRRFSGSGPSLRDELSELVQEDPDAAANILRSWIGHVT